LPLRWPSVEKGKKLQNLGEKLNINAKMRQIKAKNGENMQKKQQKYGDR
jgi:hypothetical protein